MYEVAPCNRMSKKASHFLRCVILETRESGPVLAFAASTALCILSLAAKAAEPSGTSFSVASSPDPQSFVPAAL